jgi:MoxR-like ATPase
MDPRRAVQSVHFEPGIVGEHVVEIQAAHVHGKVGCPRHGLDPGVFGKRGAGFLRFEFHVGIALGEDGEVPPERGADFLHLMVVAGGDEQARHPGRFRVHAAEFKGQKWRPGTAEALNWTPGGLVLGNLRGAHLARRVVTRHKSAHHMTSVTALNTAVQEAGAFLPLLFSEIQRCVVGQKYLTERLVIGLLANGHVLLEGVPGLAKTLSVKTLATALHTRFSRIQFTPDMLPADVVGTQIYNPQTGAFAVRRGPVFSNLVLADEINRAPAKVQSALLEAMQERQVTIGDQTFKLEDPFLVLATQNPIEQEGTYTLPEAQVDRFMLKLKIGYPSRDEERLILDLMARTSGQPVIKPVVETAAILRAREVINDLYCDDKVKDYIVDVVCATRDPEHYKIAVKDFIQMGASPRATIALTLAAKAHAFLRGRGYVTPQDVKSIGLDVLRHRVTLTYEAEAEEKTAEDIVQKIFDELPVP